MIWFNWVSDTVFQAREKGGGEGEWGSKLPKSLHYLAQGEGQGGGLRSLLLGLTHIQYVPYPVSGDTPPCIEAQGAAAEDKAVGPLATPPLPRL